MTVVKKQKRYSKSKNVIKMPKKLEIFSLKNIKVIEFLKSLKTFLNKSTKHKNNYMGDLNSKIKILKVADSFKGFYRL